MSTKKFKFGNANGNNVKGGKNNTRTILTAAGVIALGAAAGGAGYAAGTAHVNPAMDDEGKPDTNPEEKIEEQTENQSEQQAESTASQQTPQQTGSNNITEPQPTDTTQSQSTVQQSTSNDNVHEPIVGKPDEVDPDLIAQQIVNEQNIDPHDIDSPTIISVDELATLYMEDGSEVFVAAVRTPDGEQYMLADVDGDGYFTDVFDMAGNYIGEAEGNLMASDLEIMVDESGGYLAQNGDELQGDDPTGDITNTDENLAENNVITPAGEEVSDEELLAQILKDESGEDEQLIDGYDGHLDDDDLDDYDIDHDDIFEA